MYKIKKGDKCHIVGCLNVPKHVIMRLSVIFKFCDEHLKEFEMNVESVTDEERYEYLEEEKLKEEQRNFGKEDKKQMEFPNMDLDEILIFISKYRDEIDWGIDLVKKKIEFELDVLFKGISLVVKEENN